MVQSYVSRLLRYRSTFAFLKNVDSKSAMYLNAGRGFGSSANFTAPFPPIDAFSKDPNMLERDFQQSQTTEKRGGGLQTLSEINEQQIGESTKDGSKALGVFESMEFPCDLTIKIIGKNDETFLSDTLSSIGLILGQGVCDIKHSTKITGKGTFLSITVSPTFNNAKTIYMIYDQMQLDPRVKFVL